MWAETKDRAAVTMEQFLVNRIMEIGEFLLATKDTFAISVAYRYILLALGIRRIKLDEITFQQTLDIIYDFWWSILKVKIKERAYEN